MYCPNCGDQTTKGLKYCKRCGVGLSGSALQSEEKPGIGKALGVMTFLVSLVCIAGFIGLFSTVYNLGERPTFDTRALIGIMAFGGATVFGVVGLLVWLTLRVLAPFQAASKHRSDQPTLREKIQQQLSAPPIGMSVTENTTRNFDASRFRDTGGRDYTQSDTE